MLSKSCVVNHVWFLGDWIFGRTAAFLGASKNTISHTVSQSVLFETASSFQVLWKALGRNTVKSGYSGRLQSTALAGALLSLPRGWREPTWWGCHSQPLQPVWSCLSVSAGHSAPSQRSLQPWALQQALQCWHRPGLQVKKHRRRHLYASARLTRAD